MIVGVEVGRPLEVLVKHFSDRHEVARRLRVADAEEDVLRFPQGFLGVGGVRVADGGDLAGGVYETSERRGAVDDRREMLRVHGGRDDGDDVAQVGGPARLVKPLFDGEFARDADLVYRLAAVIEGLARLEAPAVALAVEIVGFDDGRDAAHRLAVYEERPDDRFLGGDVVGRQPLGVH